MLGNKTAGIVLGHAYGEAASLLCHRFQCCLGLEKGEFFLKFPFAFFAQFADFLQTFFHLRETLFRFFFLSSGQGFLQGHR